MKSVQKIPRSEKKSYSCDHDEHDGVGANDAVDHGDSSDAGENVAVNHDDH